MSSLDYHIYYERHLPHFQPPGSIIFITFRLAGSIPVPVLQELKSQALEAQRKIEQLSENMQQVQNKYLEQRRLFGMWDHALDKGQSGPLWLKDFSIARIIEDSLLMMEGVTINRIASCIMPNHVHMVLNPLMDSEGNDIALSKILHTLKSYTAHAINKKLSRSGKFWQEECYDHAVRDVDELDRVVNYVLENPVKAGLVSRREDWAWSFYANE